MAACANVWIDAVVREIGVSIKVDGRFGPNSLGQAGSAQRIHAASHAAVRGGCALRVRRHAKVVANCVACDCRVDKRSASTRRGWRSGRHTRFRIRSQVFLFVSVSTESDFSGVVSTKYGSTSPLNFSVMGRPRRSSARPTAILTQPSLTRYSSTVVRSWALKRIPMPRASSASSCNFLPGSLQSRSHGSQDADCAGSGDR